jgi:hypothetical protein
MVECMHGLKSKTFDYWITKQKEWTGIYEISAMVVFSVIVSITWIGEKIFINSSVGIKLFKLNNLIFFPFTTVIFLSVPRWTHRLQPKYPVPDLHFYRKAQIGESQRIHRRLHVQRLSIVSGPSFSGSRRRNSANKESMSSSTVGFPGPWYTPPMKG